MANCEELIEILLGGCLTVSPSEESSRHNYFKYHMGGIRLLPPVAYIQHLTHSRLKFNQLLHLNQAGVQHLISNLTDAQASSLWHWNQGLFKVWVDCGAENWAFLIVVSPWDSDVVSTQSWVFKHFSSFQISLLNIPI